MRLWRLPFFERFGLALGLVVALALSGCGGAGVKYNEFLPKRIIVIGDEIVYVGCDSPTTVSGLTYCTGAVKYDRFTINNVPSSPAAFINSWVVRLALNYGLSLSQVIEPVNPDDPTADSVRTSKWGAQGKVDRISSSNPVWRSVEEQSLAIPGYVAGDMVIISGGTNDVLRALQASSVPNASSVELKRGMTANIARTILRNDLAIPTGVLGDDRAFQIVKAAQDYQDIALDLLNRGQRNIFQVPLYDFSNSPDILNFFTPPDSCASGTDAEKTACRRTQLQSGIRLFNYVLRLLTDDNFANSQFKSGGGRILTTSGNTSNDLFYVNLTAFTTVPGSILYLYDDLLKTACRETPLVSPPVGFDINDPQFCYWNGLLATSNSVAPNFNGNDTTGAFFSGNNTTNNSLRNGRYVYAVNQYLTPTMQQIVGNTLYTFMRGFNGW